MGKNTGVLKICIVEKEDKKEIEINLMIMRVIVVE
jgi:hypothetical protein